MAPARGGGKHDPPDDIQEVSGPPETDITKQITSALGEGRIGTGFGTEAGRRADGSLDQIAVAGVLQEHGECFG